MHLHPAICCILLILLLCPAGCLTAPAPGPAGSGNSVPGITVSPAGMPEPATTPSLPAQGTAAAGIPPIRLILSDADRDAADSCGWSEQNISGSAALFMDSCMVKTMLRDGWTIRGLRYDRDLLGSRCRRSMHPDAPEGCDWCADGGPVLVLGYRGIMETGLMAHAADGTVTLFTTSLPPDTASVSRGNSTSVVFRNGTVLYTFLVC